MLLFPFSFLHYSCLSFISCSPFKSFASIIIRFISSLIITFTLLNIYLSCEFFFAFLLSCFIIPLCFLSVLLPFSPSFCLYFLYRVSIPSNSVPSVTRRTSTCRFPLTSIPLTPMPTVLPWVIGKAKWKFDVSCIVKVENQMWFMTILWSAVTILAFACKSLQLSYRTPGITQNWKGRVRM